MASTLWRATNLAPILVSTSSTHAETTLPTGYWKMGFSIPTWVLPPTGAFAAFTFGTSTASLTFTATHAGMAGTDINITILAASGVLPLSVAVSSQIQNGGATVVIQLGASSTAAQVVTAWNANPSAYALASIADSGGGGGTVVAASVENLVLPVATSSNSQYFPIGVEDTPIQRSGVFSVLAVTGTGYAWFQQFTPVGT